MESILVLGAGAIGGYFGGRLLEAGRDVHFLVRSHRAAALRCTGLVVRSPAGDMRFKAPPLLTGDGAVPLPAFDLVILACKAYDLASAIDAMAPTVGPHTTILPLLNGFRHFDALNARFGTEHVLGGLCSIGATIGADGAVEHLGPMHVLRYGEYDRDYSPRVKALEEMFSGVAVDAKASRDIVQALWEKLVMLASLAATTCLMRANVGTIVRAPGGREAALAILEECCAVANANGHAPRPAVLDDVRAMLTDAESKFSASMLRDIERGGRTEADHVLGDLITRADAASVPVPLLRLAYAHVKVHELRHTPG